MKMLGILLALFISTPLLSQAAKVHCTATDRYRDSEYSGVITGDMKEVKSLGQYFMNGDVKFVFKKGNKKIWEKTLNLALPIYPQEGKAIITDLESDLYEEGDLQLSLSDVFTWGSYISWDHKLFNVKCNDFY